MGLKKKLAVTRPKPNAQQSAQNSASTLPHDFRKNQSMATGTGSHFEAAMSPDLPMRHRMANDVIENLGAARSNQAEFSGVNRSKQTLAAQSLAHIPGQGVAESPNQFVRSNHRNQVLLGKSPNIFAQNQESNRQLQAPVMSQPSVKHINHSLNRLLDGGNRVVGFGSSGSSVLVVPDQKAAKKQNEQQRSGVFGLGGRAKNLNEQSGAGVGLASGAGLAPLFNDENHQQAIVGGYELGHPA